MITNIIKLDEELSLVTELRYDPSDFYGTGVIVNLEDEVIDSE